MIIFTGLLSGCTNQQSSNEIRNKSPQALFIENQIEPLTVNFSGYARDIDGSITSYNWDFGDGLTSTEQNPTHVYPDIGTYNTTLNVTDNTGAKGTFSTTITVNYTIPQKENVVDTESIISNLTEQGIEVNASMVETAEKYPFDIISLDEEGLPNITVSTNKPIPSNDIAGLEKPENLILTTHTYASIVIATDDEYRYMFPNWKTKTYGIVEYIDNFFIEKFGVDFIVTRFVAYDSDDSIRDARQLYYEAQNKIDKKNSELLLVFNGQYFGWYGGLAGGSTAMVFYNFLISWFAEDNIVQHEMSHLFGAKDHNPGFLHWCVQSYFWGFFTHRWCGECLNNMKTYISQKNYAPDATISAKPTRGTSPLLINFTGSGTDIDGKITSYRWYFGDGSNSIEQNPSHTFFNKGIYYAVLWITDDDNAWDAAIITINVSEPNISPTALLSANPTSGTVPLTVQFNGSGIDSDGNIISYYWTFGDGSNSRQQNLSHTYTTQGTYKVSLTVTDNKGGTGTDLITITVNNESTEPEESLLTIAVDSQSYNYTLNNLTTLDNITGQGCYINQAGKITGPNLYTGITISMLLGTIPSLPTNCTFQAIASDDYTRNYSMNELNGHVTIFNETGAEIGIGNLTMIIAYKENSVFLDNITKGPLRIAFIGLEPSITDSELWLSSLNKIEITTIPPGPQAPNLAFNKQTTPTKGILLLSADAGLYWSDFTITGAINVPTGNVTAGQFITLNDTSGTITIVHKPTNTLMGTWSWSGSGGGGVPESPCIIGTPINYANNSINVDTDAEHIWSVPTSQSEGHLYYWYVGITEVGGGALLDGAWEPSTYDETAYCYINHMTTLEKGHRYQVNVRTKTIAESVWHNETFFFITEVSTLESPCFIGTPINIANNSLGVDIHQPDLVWNVPTSQPQGHLYYWSVSLTEVGGTPGFEWVYEQSTYNETAFMYLNHMTDLVENHTYQVNVRTKTIADSVWFNATFLFTTEVI